MFSQRSGLDNRGAERCILYYKDTNLRIKYNGGDVMIIYRRSEVGMVNVGNDIVSRNDKRDFSGWDDDG